MDLSTLHEKEIHLTKEGTQNTLDQNNPIVDSPLSNDRFGCGLQNRYQAAQKQSQQLRRKNTVPKRTVTNLMAVFDG